MPLKGINIKETRSVALLLLAAAREAVVVVAVRTRRTRALITSHRKQRDE